VNHRLVLTFHPHHKNPARSGGYGVYRVTACTPEPTPGVPLVKIVRGGEFLGEDLPHLLVLCTKRAYKVRSRVDPRKVLGL
jgi:hypothetical protein